MKPFFSVIVPTYNQGNLLLRCIKSILSQSFKRYEIIVIDNNSSDNTKEIIKKYKKQIIFRKIKNKGIIAKSRNLGIKIAKGEWVSFLDSDDAWAQDKLKITYEKIKNNNFDIICNDEWIISGKKFRIWSYGPSKKNLYKHMLKYGNVMSTSASSVKKKFLTDKKIFFNESKSFVTAEDYDFFLNLASKKGIFFFISYPLGFHYFHKKSASANKKKHNDSIEAVLKFHSYNVQKFNLNKKKFYLECKSNFRFQNNLINFMNRKEIFDFKIISIFKAIFKNPVEKYYILLILIKKKFINSYKTLKVLIMSKFLP